MKRAVTTLAVAAAMAFAASAASAQTLNAIKSRGILNCGANGSLGGFGLPDAQGNWTGLDVDFCRALAAAIFNDPNKVKFVALTAKDRFTALQSGESIARPQHHLDILARHAGLSHRRQLLRRTGLLVRKALRSTPRSS